MRPSRDHELTSSVVARREIVPPGRAAESTTNAMSSGCENSLNFRNPSTTMIWPCETVCGDCCVLTPGANTEIALVVTSPEEFTTQ